MYCYVISFVELNLTLTYHSLFGFLSQRYKIYIRIVFSVRSVPGSNREKLMVGVNFLSNVDRFLFAKNNKLKLYQVKFMVQKKCTNLCWTKIKLPVFFCHGMPTELSKIIARLRLFYLNKHEKNNLTKYDSSIKFGLSYLFCFC